MRDIVGEKFNKLLVISVQNNINRNKSTCVCKCDCGKVKQLLKNNVMYGGSKSCGCINSADLSGQKFNKLLVLSKDKKSYKDKKTRHLCLCDCGNKTLVRSCDLKNNNTKSCGCIHNKNLPVGKKHWNWNSKLDSDGRSRRSYNRKEQTEWSNLVFARDDYTCKSCKVRGTDLNAHHLDGWHWCEERRFDVDNGVTLCEGCHKEFHKIYGNRHNTAEEFFEFWLCRKDYD